MQRVFTKAIGKNFLKGDVRDYPLSVWRDIARSAKQTLDDFSTALMSQDQTQQINPELARKK